MRVLFLSNYYPPFEKGGYEQLCGDVAACLHEKGHTVAVLTSNPAAGNLDSAEFEVHRLLRISPQYDSGSSAARQFFLNRSQDEAFNLRCFRETSNDFKPDVVFIWNLQGLPRALAAQAEALPDSATAYWLAGYSPAEPDEYWAYWSSPGKKASGKLLKRLFGRSALAKMKGEGKPVRPQMHHTAVVSEFMRQKGLREGTLPRSAEVIYNGVEIEDFFQPVQEGVGSLKLLQAGSLNENKGAHISIMALNELVNKYGKRQIQLTLAGSSASRDRERLEDLVKRHDLAKKVTFLGWVPREQMTQIMHDHHVLLLPTIYQEAFARVVLEAMAAGLAVIAADTGGTSEIIQHGQTGLLCSPGDVINMADEIQKLIENPTLRQNLARQGQQRVVEEFSMENMVARIEILLQKAIDERMMA